MHHAPTAFISYSWDDGNHRQWVKTLAKRLRGHGVDIKLDQWEVVPGDKLTLFMERAVRENDFVVVICTPNYKAKSEGRKGGVGYEGDIMTAEIFGGVEARKFIPVLRSGTHKTAIPAWLSGKSTVDLRGDPFAESEYESLVEALHRIQEQPPPLGKYPKRRPEQKTKLSKPMAPKSPRPPRGTWVMLGSEFFVAEAVRHKSDRIIELTVTTRTGEEAAKLNSLRSPRIDVHSSLAFAVNLDAHLVRVNTVDSEIVGQLQKWTVTLKEEEYSNAPMDITYNGLSPDEIANMRVKRVLLGELPANDPVPNVYTPANFMNEFLKGSDRFKLSECIIHSTHKAHGSNPNWRDLARLQAVFLLKINRVVDHIFELHIGQPRKGEVEVTFRGQRAPRYSGYPPTNINVSGQCPLT